MSLSKIKIAGVASVTPAKFISLQNLSCALELHSQVDFPYFWDLARCHQVIDAGDFWFPL
jgi:hypothetical protein